MEAKKGTAITKQKVSISDECFVIMPFKEPFNSYYWEIIKPVVEQEGMTVIRADEVLKPKAFVQTIWEQILSARVIIAEMTGMNPNVMYELGLCHAINRTVIMITQAMENVPADLRSITCIVYDTNMPKWDQKLGEKIGQMIGSLNAIRDPYLLPVPEFGFAELKADYNRKLEGAREKEKSLRLELTATVSNLNSQKDKIVRRDAQIEALRQRIKGATAATATKKDENDNKIYLYPISSTGLILELVEIPEGSFIYGTKGSQKEIFLPTYYLSRYAVTNEQMVAFLNAIGNRVESGTTWVDLSGHSPVDKCYIRKENGLFIVEDGFEDFPVTYVNWYGATAFCQWAGGELPTSEQWEKAARGDDARNYPWGNESPYVGLTNYGEKDWPRDVAPVEVHKYSKGKSPYGCYQMIGNVWHWTATHHDNTKQQAVRGGSFFDYRLGRREVYRFLVQPDGPDFSQGFHFCKRFL